MRIFLTGATGYIGSGVLDALVRAGHTVTALVRDNEKAARVAARGAPSGGRQSRRARVVPRGRRRAGRLHPHRLRRGVRPRAGDRSHRARHDDLRPRARPRTAGATTPRDALRHLHLRRLGARTRAGAGRRGRAVNPIAARRVASCRTKTLVLDAAHRDAAHGRRPARRGVRRRRTASSGDLFKPATNGLVRVIGDGNNHWPLVYDRDLADLYARLVARRGCLGRVSRERRRRRARQRHRRARSRRIWPCRPDVRHVPLEEARPKMGPYADALSLDQRRPQSAGACARLDAQAALVSGNAARLLEEWRAARA